MKIKNILFPVDFSPRSIAVVPHVEAAARRFGANVTILHLVEPIVLPYGPVETLAFPGLQPESLKAKAEEMMDVFAETAFEGLRVRRVVEMGDPALCIASLARDWGIGLIMMATRGRGAFRAALLGSNTAKVLHDADCPVWTATHPEVCVEGPGPSTEWRAIVCAVSSTPSPCLLRTVEDLHQTIGAAIHLVHAVPGEEAFPQRLMDSEFEESLRQAAADSIRKFQCAVGTSFEVAIETGDVAGEVARYAHAVHADLILAGRGSDRSRGGLRSHTYGIIRDAPCPVLSI